MKKYFLTITFFFFASVLIGAAQEKSIGMHSFEVVVIGNSVTLEWQSETELNCYGYYMERKTQQWMKVGFLKGSGTSAIPLSYQFTDRPGSGRFSYRVKQLKMNGEFVYSDTLNISISAKIIPIYFTLNQNFPNPFNPITSIPFELEKNSNITLKIFNLNGKEITTLVNEHFPAGTYKVGWNANLFNISSGIYIYQLQAGEFTQTKKMTVMK